MDKKIVPIFSLIVLLALPMIVNAQPAFIGNILTHTIDILFTIFDGLVIIMVAYAGILYVIARGDPSKVTTANKALIWACVGVAVGLLANFASGIVNWFLN